MLQHVRFRRRSRAEYLSQVGVAEPALGIKFVAQRSELAEARVRPAQGIRAPGMQLAPVRTPVCRDHHGLHVAEVLQVWRSMEDLDRDIPAVPAVRGGRPGGITVGCPNPTADAEPP